MPRHGATVGAYGGGGSYERGTPVKHTPSSRMRHVGLPRPYCRPHVEPRTCWRSNIAAEGIPFTYILNPKTGCERAWRGAFSYK